MLPFFQRARFSVKRTARDAYSLKETVDVE